MAARAGGVNGVICHANRGCQPACPLDVMSPSADMTAAGPTTLSSTMETCQPVRAHWIRFELIHRQPASKPYSLINN